MNVRIVVGLLIFLSLIVFALIYFQSDDDPKMKSIANLCEQQAEPSKTGNLIENNLNNLHYNDNYTDIEIVSQNVIVVRGHKIFLAANSKYFNSIMIIKNESNSSVTNDQNRLDLSNFDTKTISNVIDFMYTRSMSTEIFNNETEYGNLLRAAYEFQMDWLKCEITKRLSIRINNKNAGSLVVLAEETDSKFLMILASKYLLDNFHEICKTIEWKELIKNHPNILANVIDFQGKLSPNINCDILCYPVTITTPSIFMSLRRFFLTQRYADAEIYIGNGNEKKVFHINRAVFTAQSPIFRKQFSDSPNSIEIPNVTTEVAEEFLLYMYSSWVVQLKKFTVDLLYLSDRYQMDALKLACEHIIIDGMNIENAATIVQIADHAHSKLISTAVLDFILKHRSEIVATKAWTELKKNQPELLVKLFSNLH